MFLFVFSILPRRCPLLATFLSVLFCLLSLLISDSRFDLVWFRLSCDHGWIRSGSVNVRKTTNKKNNRRSTTGTIMHPIGQNVPVIIHISKLQSFMRFRQASFGASLRCTVSSAIPLQLLVSVIHAACVFHNLTGSTLLLSKASALTLSRSPLAAVSSAPKSHALAWYRTL